MSQTSAKWWVDSCEAITRGNHLPFVPRGGLWAPIAWGGDMVCGAGMGVKWWLGNIPKCFATAGQRVPPYELDDNAGVT